VKAGFSKIFPRGINDLARQEIEKSWLGILKNGVISSLEVGRKLAGFF
jgi:hypothetical protein